MISAYQEFIESKRRSIDAVGFAAGQLTDGLFPHQESIIRWATRMGRCAVFADTGLGKTRIELEWARLVADHTGGRVLILTPLAVAQQTIREAAVMGVDAGPLESEARVVVSNYEKMHRINPADYAGVVLDESSILKSYDGSTRTMLIDAFAATPYRMAATATPAPNDHAELGNHAEFLGICSMPEMLAEYFVHDGGSTQSWRLKGHAVGDFWRWVASWAVLVRKPSDLGLHDDRYDLPPLTVRQVTVEVDHTIAHEAGSLFVESALTLNDQRRMRRVTLADRAAKIAELVNASPDPCVVWVELNDEGEAVTNAIPDAVEVQGSDDPEVKVQRLLGFADGSFKTLVTKAKIAGFGMNWQHCRRMIFAGPTHSYEQFYQAIRRCWRFGQAQPVDVAIITTAADGAITSNMKRKADDAERMADEMLALVRETQLASVMGVRPGRVDANITPIKLPRWLQSRSEQ